MINRLDAPTLGRLLLLLAIVGTVVANANTNETTKVLLRRHRRLVLNQDGTLLNDVETTFPDLQQYDSLNEDATVQLYRFTDSNIPEGTTVRCSLDCTDTGSFSDAAISFKEGTLPTFYNDFNDRRTSDCVFTNDFTMTATVPLYVFLASSRSAGLVNGKIRCRTLPSTLSSDGTLADNVETSFADLTSYDAMNEDATVQVYKFTNSDVLDDTVVRCSLDCINDESFSSKTIAFHEGTLPITYDDRDSGSSGNCFFTRDYTMTSTLPLYIFVTSFESSGLVGGRIRCRTLPSTLSLDGILLDNQEITFADLATYDEMDEDGTVQVYQFTSSAIQDQTIVRCSLDCINDDSFSKVISFHEGTLPTTFTDRDNFRNSECLFTDDFTMTSIAPLFVFVASFERDGLVGGKIRCRALPSTLSSDGMLTDDVETTFADITQYDGMDEDGTVQVFQFTGSVIQDQTIVRCSLDCINDDSFSRTISFHEGTAPTTYDDRDQISFGDCFFSSDYTMDTIAPLFVFVTSFQGEGLVGGKIRCRALPSTLSSDGTLSDDVEVSFPNLPIYDPMDEDGTVQVYQFTGSAIQDETVVRCSLDCINDGGFSEIIAFHEGTLPTTYDDRDQRSFGTCFFVADYTMSSIAPLFVFVSGSTSGDDELVNGRIRCRALPQTLSSNGTLSDDVETTFADLSEYDPMDEDGTVQVYKFTNADVLDDTIVRCSLDCINDDSFSKTISFHEGSLPTIYDDADDRVFDDCFFTNDYTMRSVAPLFVFLTSRESNGIVGGKIRCRALPSTLSSDGTLADNVETSIADLPTYDAMDEDGTVQVYTFTSTDIPASTSIRCSLGCISEGTVTVSFHQGTLPTTYADRDGRTTGGCSFNAFFTTGSTTEPLYIFVTNFGNDGLIGGTITCTSGTFTPTPGPTTAAPAPTRNPVSGLAQDGILADNVETSFADLPQYDSSNEDGTIQLYKFTNQDIPDSIVVRCSLDCINTGNFDSRISFHQGTLPITLNDRDDSITGNCLFTNDYTMASTAPLYVFVTSIDSAGLVNGRIRCRSLPSTLTSDGTLADDVETSFADLPQYDPLDEDGTVQAYTFTSSNLPVGTVVRCSLDCTNTGSFDNRLSFNQGTLPATLTDRDDFNSAKNCPLVNEYTMASTEFLFVFVTNFDSAGLVNGRITCRALPSTLSSDGTLADDVETSFADLPQNDRMDEDGTVQVYKFTELDVPDATVVRCSLDCANTGSFDSEISFHQGSLPTDYDDRDRGNSGNCFFANAYTMASTAPLYVFVANFDDAGLVNGKIRCRALPSTLSSDGMLADNVETSFADLPQYDIMDEDGTIQLYSFTNGDLPDDTVVRCSLDCLNTGSFDSFIAFHQGSLPTTLNDRDRFDSGNCFFTDDYTMASTAPLFVFVANFDSAGLVDGRIRCRALPSTLSSDGILADNVETSFANLPTYDAMDEDGTIQLYNFTGSDIPDDTIVRCSLDCLNTGSFDNRISFRQGALPRTLADDSTFGASSGNCFFTDDFTLTSTAPLSVYVTNFDSAGLINGRIRCRSLPTTLASDGTLADGVETSFPNLPVYDPMDEDGTVQVYNFTNADIPGGTTVLCRLNCINAGTSDNSLRFLEGSLPQTLNQFFDGRSGNCPFQASYTLFNTAALYVFVTNFDDAGLIGGSLTCSTAPAPEPTPGPTSIPTRFPTPSPTNPPGPVPTPKPTQNPNNFTPRKPTPVPTLGPTPTQLPIEAPTVAPTILPTEAPTPTCFSEDSQVIVLGQGQTPMKDLKVRDKVLVGTQGNQTQYQEVYAFGHYDTSSPTDFLAIYTQPINHHYYYQPMEVSPGHLLFVHGKEVAVRADSVKAGDYLIQKTSTETASTTNDDSLLQVSRIESRTKIGAYMPLTKDGTIVVNGIAASAYVSILDDAPDIVQKYMAIMSEETLLHWWLAPYRLVCIHISAKLCENDYNEEGIAYWLAIGKYIAATGNHCWIGIQLVGLAVVTSFMAVFVALEVMVDHFWLAALAGLAALTVWVGRGPAGKKNL
ncbi:Protein hedgehog [Seminavis robusta]|uniref:Protein hedgehog n=1 Tax=Seminavis robusta TaxID=568900 RepID=A0A9N8HI54_9STRA|nr:Protein hedgehog [Seminavis robusta]|eukprot:Sro678_g185900.1 Protein hedgehog (2018) ;mRNA; r:10694-16827